MQIKKSQLLTLSLFMFASFTLSAEEGLFRPRASIGYSTYDLEFTGGGTSLADSSYVVAGFGATLARGNFYFDFSYSGSLGATYDNFGFDDDFVRDDTNFTVGIALDEGFSLFGGYKIGESTYSNTDPASSVTETVFEATGPFFGSGIAVSPTEDSSLSFNVALALLEGTLTDNDTTLAPLNATADTVGVSVGLGYNYYIGDRSGLGFKGAIQSYNFVDWTDSNYTIDDTTETLFSLEASYFVNF